MTDTKVTCTPPAAAAASMCFTLGAPFVGVVQAQNGCKARLSRVAVSAPGQANIGGVKALGQGTVAVCTATSSSGCAHGFSAQLGASITLSRCNVRKAMFGAAGGGSSRLLASSCTFSQCAKMGARVEGHAQMTARDCKFLACLAGVNVMDYCSAELSGCTVSDSLKSSLVARGTKAYVKATHSQFVVCSPDS